MLGILVCWQANSGVPVMVFVCPDSLLASGTKTFETIPINRTKQAVRPTMFVQEVPWWFRVQPVHGCRAAMQMLSLHRVCPLGCPAPEWQSEERLPPHRVEMHFGALCFALGVDQMVPVVRRPTVHGGRAQTVVAEVADEHRCPGTGRSGAFSMQLEHSSE
jgi:hypothetical protein